MSAISEYVPLLKELHLLMAQGKSDSDEAEAVRDEMDPPWYSMSEEEQHFVDNISSDLYMLAGEEIYRNVPNEQRTSEWLAPRLQEAHANHDWFTILELLRNGSNFITPDQLAWQRGLGYENLGFPEIAVLFYEFAYQQKPDVAHYAMAFLQTLKETGNLAKAAEIAESIAQEPEAYPLSLFFAADVLFTHAYTNLKKEQRSLAFERVANLIEQAFTPESEELAGFIVPMLIVQAMCYEFIGEPLQAIEAYEQILERQPENTLAAEERERLRARLDSASILNISDADSQPFTGLIENYEVQSRMAAQRNSERFARQPIAA